MKLPKLMKNRLERAEAELGSLLKEGADLSERIVALTDVERTSEDAGEIQRVICERIAANNRLAKLEIKIGSARQVVADAQAAQREALRMKLLNDLDTKGQKLCSIAKACRAAWDDFIESREALNSNSFSHEYLGAPSLPNIGGAPLIAYDLIDTFTDHLNSQAQRVAQIIQPTPAANPTVAVSPPIPSTPSIIPQAPKPEIALQATAPVREQICDSPVDGMTRVVFLRSGSEYEGRQFAVGDKAVFPPDIAKRLMENGAADLLPEDAQ